MAAPDTSAGAGHDTAALRTRAEAFLKTRDGLRPVEALPWLIAAAVPLLLPDESAFGTQVLIMVLFALSLDFILGYAGIATLGHAAYFGLGAYAAGLLSARVGWHEPLTGLLAAAAVGAAAGAASGAILLRYRDLTLLMLTLALATTLYELANTWSNVTGGYDGLMGIELDPLLGLFEWDLSGVTSYGYALAAVLICFFALRRIATSPFGQSLRGIRENKARMRAIGTPVLGRLTAAYTISAAVAAIAGALFAQSNAFLTMQVLSFDRSAEVLTVLILGGTGRLYGALWGAIVYMLAADRIARLSPEYWEFGVGLLLVLIVLFCPDGLLGIGDQVRRGWRRRKP
jgi:branched-chain amino acid transport system permease protein